MRFNVLHLIADDLRTSIGAYGHTDAAKTPHLDRLAAQGVVFDNAYSQIAVCTPSRNSRPGATRTRGVDAIGSLGGEACGGAADFGRFAKHGYPAAETGAVHAGEVAGASAGPRREIGAGPHQAERQRSGARVVTGEGQAEEAARMRHV